MTEQELRLLIHNAIVDIRENGGIDINYNYPLTQGTRLIVGYLKSKGVEVTYRQIYPLLGDIQGKNLVQDMEGK